MEFSLVLILSLCSESSIYATGGSTCETVGICCRISGTTENDVLEEVMGLQNAKRCTGLGREGGKRSVLLKFISFGKALATRIRHKWRQKYLQISFFLALALKWLARHCRVFNQTFSALCKQVCHTQVGHQDNYNEKTCWTRMWCLFRTRQQLLSVTLKKKMATYRKQIVSWQYRTNFGHSQMINIRAGLHVGLKLARVSHCCSQESQSPVKPTSRAECPRSFKLAKSRLESTSVARVK